MVYFFLVIVNFTDKRAEVIYSGDRLDPQQRLSLGELGKSLDDLQKIQERLAILSRSTDEMLVRTPFLQYTHLKGTTRYCIDAYSKKSNWRIFFEWKDEKIVNVELVQSKEMDTAYEAGSAETIYLGQRLDLAQREFLGELAARNIYLKKTQERLAFLRRATREDLNKIPYLSYQGTAETGRYSIDAYSEKAPWKIVFGWKDGKAHDVRIVKEI